MLKIFRSQAIVNLIDDIQVLFSLSGRCRTLGLGGTHRGFTIVELLIVVVVIGILAAIVIVVYGNITSSAKDTRLLDRGKKISKAIELYYVDRGYYPPIQDATGSESGCGSLTENWGHCDRNKTLADALAPYMTIDPTSLSTTAPDSIGQNYYYTSSPNNNNQTYGFMVYLNNTATNQSDGGYYDYAYEFGSTPKYCMEKYTGTLRAWRWTSGSPVCAGGN